MLSIAEVDEYFTSKESRKCIPTELATALGADIGEGSFRYTLNGKYTCSWWLRSTDKANDLAPAVIRDGELRRSGIMVDISSGVRPAMWIDLGE